MVCHFGFKNNVVTITEIKVPQIPKALTDLNRIWTELSPGMAQILDKNLVVVSPKKKKIPSDHLKVKYRTGGRC